MEQDRVTGAVQQSQQGKWTTWEVVMQRSLTWSDMWKMSPLRLAFAIRSVYDQLPSRDNLQKWGLVETPNAGSVAGPRHCITCSAIARMPLPTVGTHGDISRSFEKCVRPQKQQSPKQTRARSQISERFISCARASHTSAERDVKLPGETFLQRQTIGLSPST